MATTFVDYTGDGNASKPFSFPSYQVEDVKVEVDGVVKTVSTHYNITSYTTTGGGNVVFTSGNIPVSPQAIRIYRDTDIQTAAGEAEPKETFQAGSSVKAAALNNNQKQVLYAIAEEKDQTITAQDIKDGSITSAKITDLTIANIDISTTAAIDGTKISPDFGSQNIATTGTVDGRDVSVDGTKLDTIETNATADQTDAEIKTAYENNANTNAYTDTEKTFVNAITSTATELNTLDGITSTTTELNYVDGVTSNVQTQLDGKQPLDAELTELATMGSGTAGALADLNTGEVQTLDGITASTSELNLLQGKSIVTTIGGSATDVQIPSAQAVNERIVELVTEVGGFHPIANETSFPTTNPDINDGAGTIVSIKALASNLTSNGSGVATIANGAGSGNTVTINGMANSDTIEAGKGILVETTTTLHTYTFHREVIDPAGVTNASTLVSDFNDRYQVSGSPPSNHPDGSALGDGDLWFDTNANVMKVYDLGNTQYNTVASVGDFKLLTVVPDGATSGSPTFDGNIVSYDLRDDTNAASITNVGQLFVSLNGVVQKPNAGSYNASNEGFYLEGTNGIKFCTAPVSGSSLFVTQIGAATGVGTPSDNTVSEAKLQSDSVSEAKLKVSNSPVNGYFLSAQSGQSGGLTWAQALTSQSSIISLYDQSGTPVQRLLADTEGVTVQGTAAAVSKLMFRDKTTAYKLKFKPVDTLAGNVEFTLPSADGSANHYLSTNGSGVLSFGALNAAHLTGALPAISGANLTDIDAGATGTGSDKIFWENGKTVTQSYTIGTTFGSACNAMSAGPITINNNVVVTVGSGSTWTIV